MVFSFNILKKYLRKKISINKLEELLIFHSLEVGIKRQGNDYLLDIDILPNRYPDSSSYIGVAREINALLGEKEDIFNREEFKLPAKLKKSKEISIIIQSKDDCPVYKGIVIKGIKNKISPKWLKDFLIKHNITSHNFLVDIANFVMLETGQPLHIFDLDKISNKKIIIRRAESGEKITTLDGQKVALNKDILVIADNKKPIVIAGIKGGKGTGVGWETKNIFIEAANFNANLIYKASKKINISTDASIRFSHNLPAKLVDIGLARIANIILREGGKLDGVVQAGRVKTIKKLVGFNEEKFKDLIGIDIRIKKARQILSSYGFNYKGKKVKYYIFEVPWWRNDISVPEDLYEEVARSIGYQFLPAKKPLGIITAPKRNDALSLTRKIQNFLANVGFNEVYNYSLVSKEHLEKIGFLPNNSVKLLNPISKEFEYLRPTLAIGLLNNINYNFSFFDKLFLFEIGKTFFWENKKIKEVKKISFITALKVKRNNSQEIFFILKGFLENFFASLGLDKDDYNFSLSLMGKKEDLNKQIFYPKKFAYLNANNKTFGIIGEVKPSLLEYFGIKNINNYAKVAFAQIDFDPLLALILREREYQSIIPYPAVVRDISFFVSRNTKIENVLIAIENSRAKYLREADLFDIFMGESQADKKSLAFHLIFQAKDHTLTNQEIENDLKEVKKSLRNKFKINIR